MQDSVECAGPQKHNGESPVFIHCMILEIQLFLPIPSSFHRSITYSGRSSEQWCKRVSDYTCRPNIH